MSARLRRGDAEWQGNCIKVISAPNTLGTGIGTDSSLLHLTAKMENVQHGDKLPFSSFLSPFLYNPEIMAIAWFLLRFLDSQELFILQLPGCISHMQRFSISSVSDILGFYTWIYVVCGSLRNTMKPKIIVFVTTHIADFLPGGSMVQDLVGCFPGRKRVKWQKSIRFEAQVIYLQQCWIKP